MFKNIILPAVCSLILLSSCDEPKKNSKQMDKEKDEFVYSTERFADIEILRYKTEGFENLSLSQKKLAYYLYQAALYGRDMIYDQKYKYNLVVRRTLENIINTYKGDKESQEFKNFLVYAKRVFFSNGIHHHYSNLKIQPEFSAEYFNSLIANSDTTQLPIFNNELNVNEFAAFVSNIITNPEVAPKAVNKDQGVDKIAQSANNFYENLSEADVDNYYKNIIDPKDNNPVMHGLNSKLMKNDKGEIVEKTWKLGGMYTESVEKVVYWLTKAVDVAENEAQKEALEKLVQFYKTGDLKDFDNYCIAWVKDTASVIDVVNGFIEVYGDAVGKRGSYESVVSMKDPIASKRIAAIAKEAQWFEDNSPIMQEHKKEKVKGISAKVINVIVEAGDAAPSTPIGINLPNSNWIRSEHGSKSVSLGNIVHSYDMKATKSPVMQEFAYSEEILERIKKYGALAGELHTDMHEVIGHASGKINPGIATPDQTIKQYANTLEEARADLVALYFVLDNKLVDMGLMPSLDVAKAEYDRYIMNGLMLQLSRLSLGEQVEEAHMQNRQLIAKWVYEKGEKDKVIEKIFKEGKTYFVIQDYDKLRVLFGELLKEIQRIKSEGDYSAAEKLVENYGVKVDEAIHKEVMERYAKLDVAPYAGFIQPKLVPIMEGEEIVDVKIEYPADFMEQMLYLGKEYSTLPHIN